MERLTALYDRMVAYYAGDPARIQHFVKVHSFARRIGLAEGLDDRTQLTLEAAALVHDIGIKPAEAAYGSCAGPYQEALGPAPAREMLDSLEFPADVTDRVCFLVGHHHTYTGIDGMDYQILVEADFLVNLFENETQQAPRREALKRIFKTGCGSALCRVMFGLEEETQ